MCTCLAIEISIRSTYVYYYTHKDEIIFNLAMLRYVNLQWYIYFSLTLSMSYTCPIVCYCLIDLLNWSLFVEEFLFCDFLIRDLYIRYYGMAPDEEVFRFVSVLSNDTNKIFTLNSFHIHLLLYTQRWNDIQSGNAALS